MKTTYRKKDQTKVRPYYRKNAKGEKIQYGYVLDITVNGQRYTEYGEDEGFLVNLERGIRESAAAEKGKGSHVGEHQKHVAKALYPGKAVEEYLHWCKHIVKMAENTVRYKAKILFRFLDKFSTYPMKFISKEDLINWLDENRNGHRTTWLRTRKELSAFFGWICEKYEREMVHGNPLANMKNMVRAEKEKAGQDERYCPSKEELQQLVKVLENGSGERINGLTQEESMIKFAILSWARRKELFDLQWKHVDLEKGTINLPKKKGSRDRVEVKLSQDQIELLEWQKKTSVGNRYVFECRVIGSPHYGKSVGRAWDYRVQEFCRKAGITQFGWHSLRHYGITRGLELGMAPVEVMKKARHSSLATTNRYLHLERVMDTPKGSSFSDLL